LYILPKTTLETHSFLATHHQLQYKDEIAKIDHNFTNLPTFIINCMHGDSTINFECLHSTELQESPLAFLAENASFFYNYSTIKSYLGLCDRDIRHYGRQKTLKDKASAIIHIHRGFRFAKAIFENNFQLRDTELIAEAKTIRLAYQTATYQHYEEQLLLVQQEIKEFRHVILNKALETKQLSKYMLPEQQSLLDKALYEVSTQDFYQEHQHKIPIKYQHQLMNLFYKAHENWVTY